jgi:lipid-binding SYLF domain-containing protein
MPMLARFRVPIALLFATLLTVAAPLSQSRADSAADIDARVNATLHQFFAQVQYSRDLANRAEALLVFPTVIKAGFGIGGEYGEGELQIRGRNAGYYNIASASIGFQLGAQARSVVIMFMTPGALRQFQETDGFKIGVDGSVAIIAIGAGGSIDTNSVTKPVIGFIFDQKGLMYNLTLEGSKISRINP